MIQVSPLLSCIPGFSSSDSYQVFPSWLSRSRPGRNTKRKWTGLDWGVPGTRQGITRGLEWGRTREYQNEAGGERNQKHIEIVKRPESWSKGSLSRSLDMSIWEYAKWGNFVWLLSAAKTAEQGDLDLGKPLQVWEVMKCKKGRTRGCMEVRGRDLQNITSFHIHPPVKTTTHYCCQWDTSKGRSTEYESPDPLRSCGVVSIKRSDEMLEGDRF